MPQGSDILGISTMTGQPITLAEAVAAAKARVAADQILGDETPEYILRLARLDLSA